MDSPDILFRLTHVDLDRFVRIQWWIILLELHLRDVGPRFILFGVRVVDKAVVLEAEALDNLCDD